MTALAKWRPDPDSPIKPGYQCGNPKCHKVRGASNHWFMAEIAVNVLDENDTPVAVSFYNWNAGAWPEDEGADPMVPLCGEQCATELLNLWLSERTAEAMQSTKVAG